MKLEILGGTYTLTKFSTPNYIEYIQDVIQSLEKPFVIDSNDPCLTIESKYHNEKIYHIQDYLLSLATNEGSFLEKIHQIAEEDEEWTKWRNSIYQHVVYRKFILKPQIIDIAKIKLNEIKLELEAAHESIQGEECKQAFEKGMRKGKFSIGKVYTKQMPKGKEEGVDGLFDAEIIDNRTDNSLRFVQRDVFDVGVYSYPYRLNGNDDVLNRNIWTEEEREIADWLSEFGVLSSRTRM